MCNVVSPFIRNRVNSLYKIKSRSRYIIGFSRFVIKNLVPNHNRRNIYSYEINDVVFALSGC